MKLYRKQQRIYYDGDTNWDPQRGPRTDWYFEEDFSAIEEQWKAEHTSPLFGSEYYQNTLRERGCKVEERYIEYEGDK